MTTLDNGELRNKVVESIDNIFVYTLGVNLDKDVPDLADDIMQLIDAHDQQLLEAVLEGAKTLSKVHKSDKIVGFRPCEAVPVEHIKSVFEGRK